MQWWQWACLDGNEAVALVAHRLSDVCAIYPITPSSAMGEFADAWSAAGRTNLWGSVPAGGRDAVRGRRRGCAARCAAEGHARHDVHRVAGPAPHAAEHVQDRRRADPGGHPRGGAGARHPRPVDLRRPLRRDVGARHRAGRCCARPACRRRTTSRSSRTRRRCARASRSCTSSTASAPRTRSTRSPCSTTTTCAPSSATRTCSTTGRAASRRSARCCGAARRTPMSSSRRARRPTDSTTPCRRSCRRSSTSSAERTGRRYSLVDYHGAPDADRVVVLMGSGAGAAAEVVDELVRRGEKVGLVTVRLYRPFPVEALPRRPAGDGHAHRRARPRQGARRARRAAAPRCRPGPAGGRPGRHRHRRTLRARLEGVHPAGRRRGLHRAGRRRRRSRGSPSASSTTSPGCRCRAIPTSPSSRPRAAPSSTASAATAPSARTSRASRSSATTPTCGRRATSSTTRRSPAPSRCRTCGSARIRSAPPT